MDTEVLKRKLRAQFDARLDEALLAVQAAPDGRWLAGSEWQIRDIFQRLTTECFQSLVQFRLDTHPLTSQEAFSPCGRDGVAKQGRSPGPGSDHRR
jgi:hypothetical protein